MKVKDALVALAKLDPELELVTIDRDDSFQEVESIELGRAAKSTHGYLWPCGGITGTCTHQHVTVVRLG